MTSEQREARARRVAELETLIPRYQASYYSGEGEISDAEFDALWDELRTLAPESPVLAQVGSEFSDAPEGLEEDGFPKVRHLIPMGSQDKAANPAEFLAWAQKIAPTSFVVQHKLDGASLELQYEAGRLARAVTRGDGLVGDEITRNARAMAGCVLDLGVPFTGGVRGEVIMPRSVWMERFPEKANCRNAANGIMRRKDGVGCELLRILCYDAASVEDDRYFSDEETKIAWLTARGFDVTPTEVFARAEEVLAFRERVASARFDLPYDIDGLVVKDRETDIDDLRRARPERQIAFKFDLEEAVTTLHSVEWSESGATYTPIGVVDPVRLAGTTVKRANLNNPDMIRALGLRIGSRVVVVKRGEIIPKIERLAPVDALGPAEEDREILLPTSCASCGSTLVDGGTRLYCPNLACPKRVHHRIEKWISVLDIREFGTLLLKRLFDAGRLERVADLYTLTAGELSQLDRMGDLSAAKVARSLYTPRQISLAAFVAGFDLEGVGETIMDKVAAAGFDTLEKLRSASVEDLSAVHGLGEITARTIVEGLEETRSDMDAVLAGGIVSIAPPPSAEEAPLRGLSFCFTGELKTMKRSEAEARVKRLGGVKKDSVTKDTTFLVTNDPSSGSGKSEKARKLGVRILDEDAFIALLRGDLEGVVPKGGISEGGPPRGEGSGSRAGASGGEVAQGDLFGG